MEYARLIINYNGQWDKSTFGFYNYKGGSSKGMRVPKNLTYAELLERIYSLVNVDLSKSEIKMKSVFQTSYRSPLVEINDDNDVEFLLCEDKVIPQVGITLVKRVDQSSRGAELHDVQVPVHQTRVNLTHVASASEGNQVSGSVPATQPSQCTSNVQSTDAGEEFPTYYSDDLAMNIEHESSNTEDGDSNHDFQPNTEHESGPVEPELGLDNAPVNHGLGPDSVHRGCHNNATSDPTSFHTPGARAFTSEDLSTVASSMSDDHISKKRLFPSKKELRRVLEMHALKENFDFKVRRSTTLRYEVGCADIDCKWRLAAKKIGQGSSFLVRRYDGKHTCPLDKTHRRRWQAKARKPGSKPRKRRISVPGEREARQKQCGKCGELGHNRTKCKNLVLPDNISPPPPPPPVIPGEKRERKCRTCGATGHNRQSCPNWEPPTSNENQMDC